MVRLVFRPYTQIWPSICTSERLRASTRVSSGFALFRHSSPSFGSQHISSGCVRIMISTHTGTAGLATLVLSLSLRIRVCHPNTRLHVRLSLVRVSRRVVQGQTWTTVQATAFPKETMQPKSHALTLVLFSSLHRLPLEAHHTAISHRRLPSVRLALSRDRFPFNNFTCYLTPFSRCFSSSLTVLVRYRSLANI